MEQALRAMSIDDINNASPVEIDLPDDEVETVVEVTISTGEEMSPEEFKQNLADVNEDGSPRVAESVLESIASTLLEEIRTDKNSRAEWEKTVTDGMQLLGMKIEERTEPWKGACGVFHSILAEAVIKFQSEMIMETFPASGPVHTKILGKPSKDKDDSADRVKEDMNWQLTDNMPEYRPEHERMLWNLGYSGAAFKKVYFDPNLDRQVSIFVPAEDMLIPYGNSDITNAPRVTQMMKKTENELRKLMQSGFYREVELGEPTREQTDIEKKKDSMSGFKAIDDNRYVLYESHVELDVEGYEDTDEDGNETEIALPYVMTFDSEGKVFALYRNWKQDDPKKLKRDHFVQYTFIPGFGPYGMGYIHILGGYAKGATSVLRQLVDAGTLANLPGGLKARGLRIKGDDTPIAPGEFRDVDVPAGTIRDNIVNLPYKEPSNTLFLLFKEVVDEGRSLASTADMKVADMNQQAPVGTTLAIIERMMKVMSAVQARVHAAMRKEFALLKDIIKDYTPEEYSYETDKGRMVKQSDYEHVDILPVSDPNASSTAQRIAQYQAALQLSQSAPQLYDLPELHRETLRVLGMKNANAIIPDEDDIKPKDPVMENMNIMNSKPVKAFLYQDHKAHMAVHMAAAQDPALQALIGQNPQAMAIQSALQAHLMSHAAFQYRIDIEKQMGVELPDMEEDLPQEIEASVSKLVAEAAPLVLAEHSKEAAQKKAMEQAQDPLVQLQQKELQIKEAEVQRKAAKDQADGQAKMQELQIKQAAVAGQAQASQATAQAAMVAAQATAQAAQASTAIAAQKVQADSASKAVTAALERDRIAATERAARIKMLFDHNKHKTQLKHDKHMTGFNAAVNLHKKPKETK